MAIYLKKKKKSEKKELKSLFFVKLFFSGVTFPIQKSLWCHALITLQSRLKM